jgi:predicted lipoprotein with Yx(FWY)xxD motif
LGNQVNPVMIADGAGGVNLTWYDGRSGNYDIYVQRVNNSGVSQWTSSGVALCTATNHQTAPAIALDATAGAIVAWVDTRSGVTDIYARRVSSAGAPLWTADGVVICNAASGQDSPVIISDGSGGAIIAWQDSRNGNVDIFAQRVNSTGVVQWTANGVPVCVATGDQNALRMISDGAGGAILAWEDHRAGNPDIFVQRINSAGTAQWFLNGGAVADLIDAANFPELVSDGASGAIIVWDDSRNATTDIYAQRVSAGGVSQWQIQGVPIVTATGDQYGPKITSDGTGGAIIAWYDNRASNFDIYAQRIAFSGALQWVQDGVPVCASAQDQLYPVLTTDGAGGAIISWPDIRNGYQQAYAQRMDAQGVPQWTANGVQLSTVAGNEVSLFIQPDGAGNGIVAWQDQRSGTTDIYAQRMDGIYGYWGHPEPVLNAVSDVRNDQGGKVAVDWKASGRDIPVPSTISFYSIWRAVSVAPFNQTIGAPAPVTLEQVRKDTPPGTIMKSPASSYYFELVGTQNAYRFPDYSFVADTRADSIAGNTATTYFMVTAHSIFDNRAAFMSNVVSGHSVDNLAPVAPLSLTAQRTADYVHLKWHRVHVADLKNYSVFRKTSTGVTPIPANFVASATDTVLTDTSPPASAAYYIVTANDIHANESPKSNEASVAAATNVGDLPPITALMLLQNRPNPFASSTELELGLPAKSDVSLEVFDVAGRKVKAEVLPGQKAGWEDLRFDGRNDAGQPLPSGVYFYRITAAGETVTRKLVIAR